FDFAPLQCRRRRLHRWRPHVSPDNSGFLDAGVGFQFDVLAKAAFFRLRREIDALARHIIFPAVIGTAQSTFLVLSEQERNAAMGAKFIDQTDLPFAVAKANQALTHQLHAYRWAIRLWNFRRQKKWRPVAPQQLAHQCSRADAAELIVLFT